MKKIMFNDRYGLTRAVLDGQKTMTRRVISTQMLHYLRELYGDNTGLWWQWVVPAEPTAAWPLQKLSANISVNWGFRQK